MNSAEQIARDVQSGSMSATSVLEMSLDAIRARNDELNVFLYVDEQGALEAASSIDARVARGEHVGPLAGVPVALGADDPLLFGPRLTAQYEIARYVHGFTDADLADLARTSVLDSVAPEPRRTQLLAGIDGWLAGP